MKKCIIIFMFIMLLTSISGCKRVDEINYEQEEEEIIKCISSELGAYMVSDKLDLKDISIEDLFEKRPEAIKYLEGRYSNEDNMYMIISASTWDKENFTVFDKYFASRFDEYYEKQLGNSSIYVYFHHEFLDVDFKELENHCFKQEEDIITEKISSNILNQLNKTTRVVIKSDDKEIGTIKSKDSIKTILNALSDSDTSIGMDVAYLCVRHTFDFEMYNDNDLIDTIEVWQDGLKVLPKNADKSGCFYYNINDDDLNLRNVIEKETDYLFYNINTISNDKKSDKVTKRLIAKDNTSKYYYEIAKNEDLYITFLNNSKTMSLEYALKNNYIIPKQLGYSGLFTREDINS